MGIASREGGVGVGVDTHQVFAGDFSRLVSIPAKVVPELAFDKQDQSGRVPLTKAVVAETLLCIEIHTFELWIIIILIRTSKQ